MSCLLLPRKIPVSCHTHAFPWHSPPPPCLTSSQSKPGLSCPLTESTATLGACPTGVNCVPASLCPMVIIIITRPKPPYGRRGLTGKIVGPGYTSLISININEIANQFHHLVCQIPHCTMHYALWICSFFSTHMRGQTYTLLHSVIIYRSLLSKTFHRNYHCLLDCKNDHRLYSMHPGEIAPSPLASLVSVVNKILISKVSSTPPHLVMDEIRNRV